MPARELAAEQRQSIERRVADLAATLAGVSAVGDTSKLAEQFEDLGNRFLDLSDWLSLVDGASIRVDDARVVGGGRGAV